MCGYVSSSWAGTSATRGLWHLSVSLLPPPVATSQPSRVECSSPGSLTSYSKTKTKTSLHSECSSEMQNRNKIIPQLISQNKMDRAAFTHGDGRAVEDEDSDSAAVYFYQVHYTVTGYFFVNSQTFFSLLTFPPKIINQFSTLIFFSFNELLYKILRL